MYGKFHAETHRVNKLYQQLIKKRTYCTIKMRDFFSHSAISAFFDEYRRQLH